MTSIKRLPDKETCDIVTFWKDAGMECWFAKEDAFDDALRHRYLDHHLAAAGRNYDQWAETPEGALALLLLLDQFPRNAFRNTAHMFATDMLALMFARRFLITGHDRVFDLDLRMFFYLPFTHSESLADQELSVELRQVLGPSRERHARKHRDIIRRFGRFPHRNALLGRESTREEKDFLAAGGFAG